VTAPTGPRTAFVTGATGQDGSYLVERLVAEGVEVHALVRPRPDRDAPGAQGVGLPPSVVVHEADLRDTDRVRDLLADVRPDEVYNLAGQSSVAASWEHPVDTGASTGLGAVALFDAARRVQEASGREVRVVQASSAEIFGDPDRTPQDETTALRPLNPYAAAKAYAHHSARILRARGLHLSACVLYNHESPRRPERFVTRKITRAAARIAVEGRGTLALGRLDVRRDWGWAPDYVDAMVRAARHPTADEYVVATGRTHSVEDLVRVAFEHAGVEDWRAHVVVDPAFVRPAEAATQVGDPSHARDALGWTPSVGFEEIVARMVDHDLRLLG